MITRLMLFTAVFLSFAPPAHSDERMTCTGILIDVDLSARSPWPLAVIFNADSKRTCTISRDSAGHDPLRQCDVGEKCTVVGIFRKIGETYSLRRFISIDHSQ
jgi:hypothetical protein